MSSSPYQNPNQNPAQKTPGQSQDDQGKKSQQERDESRKSGWGQNPEKRPGSENE